MHQKLARHLTTIMETGFILLLLGAVFIVMAYHATVWVMAIGFCVTLLIIIYLTFRFHFRIHHALQRVTDEISILPNDLSEKSYKHIQDETQDFYEELTRVKQLLDKRGKMRQELLDIVKTVASNIEFGKLLRELLPRFNEATHSSCSAFYTVNQSTNKLEIKHSMGFSKNMYSEFDLNLGEGLIGTSAVKTEITLHRDIPEDTVFFIRTFLGKIKPRCLMVVPVVSQEVITGVLVCASIYDYTREDCEMAELIKHYMGVAVNNGINYDKTKRLTNELTFQNKLIQDQYEEMKGRLKEKRILIDYLVDLIEDECLYALDNNRMVLAWNQAAEQIHGIKRQTAIGKKIDRLYEEYQWPPIQDALQSTLNNGSYSECFWRTGAEGEKNCYEMNLTCMYNQQNEIIGIISRIKRIKTG